ncbi:hypothetical protein JHK87_010472 [Glycine soja]|nr:hypothetical protein JHK87_010472 [Glycine soja]
MEASEIVLEFAGIFNDLKSEVHVFIRQNKVLRGFDEEVVEQSKADVNTLQPKSVEQNVVPSKQSKPPGEESATKIDLFPNQVLSGTKGQTTVEKSKQPIVASFSVCSGNGTNQGSEEPNQNLKRKRKDTDDSECHSEDVEEESAGAKKTAGG